MSRLPPHSPWPSALVATSRSGATPKVPTKGVIGQEIRSLKWRVPSRVRAAGARSVPEDPGRVVSREFGPSGGLSERTPSRADRDPGVVVNHDLLDRDHQDIAPLGSFHPDRPGDRVDQRRHAIEAGPESRNRLVLLALEVSAARVERLDLEQLARLDPQQIGGSSASKANLRAWSRRMRFMVLPTRLHAYGLLRKQERHQIAELLPRQGLRRRCPA